MGAKYGNGQNIGKSHRNCIKDCRKCVENIDIFCYNFGIEDAKIIFVEFGDRV